MRLTLCYVISFFLKKFASIFLLVKASVTNSAPKEYEGWSEMRLLIDFTVLAKNKVKQREEEKLDQGANVSHRSTTNYRYESDPQN